jgi:hypothetical protein
MGDNIVRSALMLAAVTLIGLAQAGKTPEDVASQTVTWLVDGRYDDLYQSVSPEMRTALPVEALKSSVGPQVQALGKLIETRKPAIQQSGGDTARRQAP